MAVTPSDKTTLHVVFTMSAAGTIRQAFAKIGCADRVIGFMDNLSFGPIDAPGASARQEWVRQSLLSAGRCRR